MTCEIYEMFIDSVRVNRGYRYLCSAYELFFILVIPQQQFSYLRLSSGICVALLRYFVLLVCCQSLVTSVVSFCTVAPKSLWILWSYLIPGLLVQHQFFLLHFGDEIGISFKLSYASSSILSWFAVFLFCFVWSQIACLFCTNSLNLASYMRQTRTRFWAPLAEYLCLLIDIIDKYAAYWIFIIGEVLT